MNMRSYLFTRAPRWHQYDFGAQKQLSDSLQSWLTETGSLTQRLKKQYNNQFRVDVQIQNWAHCFHDETAILNQPQHRYQLIREVILQGGNQPVILARTVIPPETLAFANQKLSRLGTKPLGEVIFAYPDLKILKRQYSALPNDVLSSVFREIYPANQPLWGRQTIYLIKNHPLMVSEFFLSPLI